MSQPSMPTPQPSVRASLDRVAAAAHSLGLVVHNITPHSVMFQCPVHSERTPSAHATWRPRPGEAGYTMVYCHGCHARGEEIAAALGLSLSELFDEPLPPRPSTPARRRRPSSRLGKLPPPVIPRHTDPAPVHTWVDVEQYTYHDDDGSVVQYVLRQECHCTGTKHKNFPQRYPSPQGRLLDKAPTGFVPVLYRLPQVLQAIAAKQTIWVLEGEKDVHSAEGLGLVATTNPSGGGSFGQRFADLFAAATVHAVLDRDATGWTRGVTIYDEITAAGGTVRLFLPAVAEPKADFTDHVEAGHQLTDLVEVDVAELRAWQASAALTTPLAHLRTILDEAQARLELIESAPHTERDTHHQAAQRWAKEAQVRWDRIQELVRSARDLAVRSGTQWASEAADSLVQATAGVVDQIHTVHELAGVALPASFHPTPDPAGVSSADSFVAPGRQEVDPGGLSEHPTFRVIDNKIMAWKPKRGAAPEEDEGTFDLVLGLAVKVVSREFLEVEDPELDVDRPHLMGRTETVDDLLLNPTEPRRLAGYVVAYIDPATGEEIHLRISAEQWKDHSWLEALPGPPDYDHRKSGLDTIQRAVLAISPGIDDVVRYRATGWRRDGEHFAYVHARGVIDRHGHRTARTRLSGVLSRYNLPDPVQDPGELRALFLTHSATMLERLPHRISVPLLGHIFRAAMGHNPWTLALVGAKGSYKTSVAEKAMHHFGELWSRTSPGSSMSGNGTTFNALRIQLHQAKDTCYWMDDFAPTKGWLDAQKRLEEMARLIHNREGKGRSDREGQETHEGPGPRASGLTTSEVLPRPGSGGDRLLVVPIAAEDVSTRLLFPLEEDESRHGRAVVMASFIQWLATDLLAKRKRYRDKVAEFVDQLKAQDFSERLSASAAEPLVGWLAVTDWLVERQAITAAEAAALVKVVRSGLQTAAAAAVDPDIPSRTGTRVRELLAFALRTGLANVSDARTGDCPPWPLAGRLGWRRTVLDDNPVNHRARQDRMGLNLGWVLHDPDDGREPELWCDPAALEPVLKAAAGTMTDSLQIDRNTACRALAEEGLLICDTSENRTRFTIKRRISSEARTTRVNALDLGGLLGDSPDDGADPTVDPPVPSGGNHPTGFGPLGIFSDAPPLPEYPGGVAHSAAGQASPGLALTPLGHDENEDVMGLDPAADLEGTVAIPMPIEIARTEGHHDGPCVICQDHCTSWVIDEFDGEWRIHHRCWVQSTRATRETAGHSTPAAPAADTPATAVSRPGPRTAAPVAPARGMRAPGVSAAPRLRAAVAIVDTDAVYCSDGSTEPVPQLTHAGDLARLAESLHLGTQVTRYRVASGQVWITEAIARGLGIDTEALAKAEPRQRETLMRSLTAELPLVTEAKAAGWTLGGKDGGLGRWTRLWQTGRSTWLAVLPAMDPSPAETPILEGNPAPQELAHRLGLFASTVGYPFAMNAQTTGFDFAFDLRYRDRDRFFTPYEPCEPASIPNVEADQSWSRVPTPEETQHTYLHLYDRSGSYLPVAGMPLGVGQPLHYPNDPPKLDLRLPGYCLIEVPESGDWRLPNPLDPIVGRWAGRTRWVTTPALQIANELGYEPQILEAYIWHDKAAIFEAWYQRLRDARKVLMAGDDLDHRACFNQVKAIYARTIGMMGSTTFMEGRRGYAPDRRHMIIGKSRANVLRRIWQIGTDTGRWPVAAITDTIAYTSNEADPIKAWPGKPEHLGRQLGQYKPEGTALLADHLPYLTGEPWKGREAIVTPSPGDE